MPWVKAILRGQKVYARADAGGALFPEGGRVEVRYKPNDGRRYQARADNLEVVDATLLPDDTCGPAGDVAKAEPAAKAKGSREGGSAAAGPSTPHPAGSIIVYADGACSGNPGPCGLGMVFIDGPRRVELSEYLGTGTNNIAELRAAIAAKPSARLAYVPGHSGVPLNERADALAREAVTARKTRREVIESKPTPAAS